MLSRYLVFVGLLAAIVALNWFLRFDVDERAKGEPLREWKAKATYPKSFVHGLVAFGLTMTGLVLGLHTLAVIVIVFGVLLAFEYSQRFLDWFDVLANGIGIAVAVLLPYLVSLI